MQACARGVGIAPAGRVARLFTEVAATPRDLLTDRPDHAILGSSGTSQPFLVGLVYARVVTDSFVLYVEASWSSPWLCTVFVALREKAIPVTTALAMLRKGSGAIEGMHEKTLTGTAPVLQHGSFWLAESLAIVEYLEELVPEPPMLPVDQRERARARQLMTWMRNEHEVLRRERPSELIMYGSKRNVPPLSAQARGVADDLIRVAARLGANESGCVFGGRFGIIDIELAFALMRLLATGYPVPDVIAAYVRAVWSRPSVREFVEHPRPPNPPS